MKQSKQERDLGRKGKQRLLNYTLKARLLFLLVFTVVFLGGCYIYNSIYMFSGGLLEFQEPDNNPLHIFLRAIEDRSLAAIIIPAVAFFSGRLSLRFVKKQARKDPRGFKVIENGTEGNSHLMDDEEKRKIFELLDQKTPDGIIMGVDKNSKELITLPWDNVNQDEALATFNIALFGPPGQRKTSGVLLPNIFNFLMRRMSIVVTDPKGEIYRETIAAARYMNYNIKILNLQAGEIKNSDGFDIIKLIRTSDSPQDSADLAATIIMENTGTNTGDSFWYSANINCLKLCLLFVAKAVGFNPGTGPNAKGETRTMEAVYELITSDDMASRIKGAIDANPEDKALLSSAFNVWANHREAESIKAGLGMRLSILQNPDLIRVLSEDDISFEELNDMPTIIYVLCSDSESTYKSILTLFTTFLFVRIASIADSHTPRGLDRRLMMVFEEFGNIGKIPELDKRVATLRDRLVGMIFCFQNVGQIMDIYSEMHNGRHMYETILGGCAVQLCLSANDPTGQKYFSDLTGPMTVEAEMTAQQVGTFLPKWLKFNTTERVQKTGRGRPVLQPDDIKKIKKTEILICPQGHNVTIENKYFYKLHPMYNVQLIDKDGNLTQAKPTDHVPIWRRKQIFEERPETMRYSPMTAKQILEDQTTPKFIEGYAKQAQTDSMHLPWYYKFLSRFFELEFEEDEEEDEDPRHASSHNYQSLLQNNDLGNEPQVKIPVRRSQPEEHARPSQEPSQEQTSSSPQPKPSASQQPLHKAANIAQDKDTSNEDSNYRERSTSDPVFTDYDPESGPEEKATEDRYYQEELACADDFFQDMDIF